MSTKTTIILMLLFISLIGNAQSDLIGKFNIAYANDLEFRAQKGNKYQLELYSPKGMTGYQVLDEKDRKNLIKKLTIARDKYVEWRAVSVTEHIKDVSKKIKTGFINISGTFLFNNEWVSTYGAGYDFYYIVNTIGEYTSYFISMETIRWNTYQNNYINGDFKLTFNDVSQIDSLLTLIGDENIKLWQSKPKPSALLKD